MIVVVDVVAVVAGVETNWSVVTATTKEDEDELEELELELEDELEELEELELDEWLEELEDEWLEELELDEELEEEEELELEEEELDEELEELDEAITVYKGSYGLCAFIIGAGNHVTPSIRDIVKSGEFCGSLGLVTLIVIVYLSPAISSSETHMNNVSVWPSQYTDPLSSTKVSHAKGQNMCAEVPPSLSVPCGYPINPDWNPSISNPGVLLDVEYSTNGTDPFTFTPGWRVIVIVFGEEV